MKVLNRVETYERIKEDRKTHRIVTPRYVDGEYLLMRSMLGHKTETGDKIKDLLLNAIKLPNQFVCINELKRKNIISQDKWYRTHHFLAKEGGHELYGGANWLVYDFQNECDLIPYFFGKKLLIVTGHGDLIKDKLGQYRSDFDVYTTALSGGTDYYERYRNDLIQKCGSMEYDNVLFACGPIGKVLLTDLIDVCQSHLIDIGSLVNAVIGNTGSWRMSWAKTVDIDALSYGLLTKVRGLHNDGEF